MRGLGLHYSIPIFKEENGSKAARMLLGFLSLLPDLERYYKSSVTDSIAAAIWFTGTTKKSPAYLTLADGLIILDHEDRSCASAFHSHNEIDEKYPLAPAIRTWSPSHGEDKVRL